MIDEQVFKLALSFEASPVVYALQIGSVVSRAAGIPIGREIAIELIRKLAAMKSEEPIEHIKMKMRSWQRKSSVLQGMVQLKRAWLFEVAA